MFFLLKATFALMCFSDELNKNWRSFIVFVAVVKMVSSGTLAQQRKQVNFDVSFFISSERNKIRIQRGLREDEERYCCLKREREREEKIIILSLESWSGYIEYNYLYFIRLANKSIRILFRFPFVLLSRWIRFLISSTSCRCTYHAEI